MRYCQLTLLALFSFGFCQGDPTLRRGLSYWLRSRGPSVTISMRWDPAHCSMNIPRWYSVELRTLQRESRTIQVSEATATFTPSDSFPIVFWNHYIATISIYCDESGWSRLSSHQILTGPGELPPLKVVRAIGGVRNATLSWESARGASKFDDSVEIKVCRRGSRNCSETVRADLDAMGFTVEQLSPGVEYTAQVRRSRRFEGISYRSQAVFTDFRTELGAVRKFPSIDDLAVQVLRKDGDLDLALRFTKPEAPKGAVFKDVMIDIFNDRGSRLFSFRSRDTIIEIRNLLYSASFMVNVRAIYEDGHAKVESAVVSKVFGTGPKVFPDQPRILEVMSITNSSALIRWTRTVPKSAGLSYHIVLNNGVSMDIEKLKTGYMVIDKNLKPCEVYNVTLVTLLPGDSTSRISFLEQKQFKMLPEDVLVAKPVIEDILEDSIHLKWNVTLPEGALDCFILVNYCPLGKSCSPSMIPDPTITSAYLGTEPFAQYSIALNTTCIYFPNIVVSGVSETLRVSTAALPGPPLGVTIRTVRGRRIVQWSAEKDRRFNILRYKIDATAVSSSNRTTLLTTSPRFDLSALAPRSRYVLRISACIDSVGQRCGSPAMIETTSSVTSGHEVGYPSRPKVEFVSRRGGQIVISWSVPTEPRGPIDGYEYAYARKGDGFSPSNWAPTGSGKRSATVTRLQADVGYIFHVVAFNLDSKGRKLFSPIGFLEVTTNG